MSSTKGPRWGAAQRSRCEQQFDLFVTTQGAEGWDPDNTEGEYIKEVFAEDDICRPFLQACLGGHSVHKKNSDKGIQGYNRCASEFYVQQALNGVRRNDHRDTKKKSALVREWLL